MVLAVGNLRSGIDHLVIEKGATTDQGGKKFNWIGTRPVCPNGVDKVTDRAKCGADFAFTNMSVGKVLRSQHAHAQIKSIDTSAATAMGGAKSVITVEDLPDHDFAYIGPERVAVNFYHVTRNVLSRAKALYIRTRRHRDVVQYRRCGDLAHQD